MTNPRDLRILMVSEFFFPHWTGIAKTFLVFAKMLASQGHAVSVLTSRYSPDLAEREELFGFTIYRSKCLFRISRTYYSAMLLVDFVRLARNADVVIINSPFSNILFVSILSKLLGKRTVIYHQGDLILPSKSGSRISKLIIEGIFNLFTISAMALADKVSTYTEDYARNSRVMRFFMHKFVANMPAITCPQGVANPDFSRKLHELSSRGPLVGFAGRFVEEKGFDILLRAVPLVCERYPNVNFAFAGEVNVVYERFFDLNRELLQQSGDKVHILGLLKEDDLFEYYRALTVFVISSRSDCFPVTQMEAAVCGVPIVVTDIPGARVLVRSSGFGEVAEPGDPVSLANAICKVLENRDFYRERYEAACQFLSSYERFKFD